MKGGNPGVNLSIGKQLNLVFFVDGKNLAIFVRWEAEKSAGKPAASRLSVMRRFTQDASDKIVRALLKSAGYDVGGRRTHEQFYMPRTGISISRMPNGGVVLSLFNEKSFDFDRLRLRLKASQVAEVCRGVAPALGWELTE